MKTKHILKIRSLFASIDGNDILRDLNLDVKQGEVHAIMGPNGSGKSTLAHVLIGNKDYIVTNGEIEYEGHDLLSLSAHERACKGIFMAFQYPIDIPGVSNMQFLKTAVNSLRKYRGLDELNAIDFIPHVKAKVKQIGGDEKLLHRAVNEGFSGGEKKRNEILQMLVLEPKLAILDETDSGLDIDALRVVAEGVNAYRSDTLKDQKGALIIITHYQRLLNYIKPDYVHIFMNGRIVQSAGPELAHELEAKGYKAWAA